MTIDQLKRATGHRAAEYVRSGMVVGLGSGSTAKYATLRLAERLRQGDLRDIVAVPTSDETARLATAEGIPLVSLDEHPRIDVTIDGADEVDPNLDLIKGLGGYLLREKIVAAATDTEVIVGDDSKLVERLGTRSPVPVEVIRFGWHNTRRALEATGAVATTLRLADDKAYVTDEGNWIIDCSYDGIDDAIGLSQAINAIPGVVENGLFIGIAKIVVVASVSGISVLERR
jgi:ribose 5-phosphate isomerase A